MKSVILILFLLCCLLRGEGQERVKRIKLQEMKEDFRCVYKLKYTASQRSRFYPFNVSDTVKLVSYRYHRHNYPIKGDTVLSDSLVEIKTLTKTQVDKLTDILYNNFYKSALNYGSLAQCFFPRNAILFFNKSGKLKQYVLICFHCDRYETSSEEMNFGEDCSGKIEQLRRFFINSKVSFGTDEAVNVYPGEKNLEVF